MNKIPLIQVLFLALFINACSPENEAPKEEEEVVEEGESEGEEPEEGYSRASFTFGGEFEEQRTTSEKSGEANLFALQFYDAETQSPYAFVLGDDISQIKVDFIIGRSYMLKVTYIKNGQELIFGQEGRWSTPFGNSAYVTTNFNQPFYSSDILLNSISSPFIHLKDESGGLYVEIERFHGIIENFEITEEKKIIPIELQRLVFGITLNVEGADMSHDSIYFALHSEFDGPRKYYIPLTEGKGTLEIPYISLGFPGMSQMPQYLNTLDMAVLGEYQEDVHISIGTPDHHTLFFDDTIAVTRNTMTIIDLTPENSGATSNGGFTINFGEEMLDQNVELFAQ